MISGIRYMSNKLIVKLDSIDSLPMCDRLTQCLAHTFQPLHEVESSRKKIFHHKKRHNSRGIPLAYPMSNYIIYCKDTTY